MRTSLTFEAPSDLSVGTVRIKGASGLLKEWIATPNNRILDDVEAAPGFYIAEIAPAGVHPRSVIFEVLPGMANNIVAPVFSVLSAEGNGPTFLNVSDPRSAVEALSTGRGVSELPVESRRSSSPSETVLRPVRSAESTKRLTVALAEEVTPGKESWRPFLGSTSVDLTSGRLNIVVGQVFSSTIESRPRVRLSLAIERVRVDRLLLPMYHGGTNIELSPSHLSTCDVELQITPVDPTRRALLRALAAGTLGEAVAVRDSVLIGDSWRFLEGAEADPWAAMLSGLLFLRFPEIFGPCDQAWIDALLTRADWAYDVHVIHARTLLASAGKDPSSRQTAASNAVAVLAKAQTLGAPYFSYSNQLIGHMLAALCSGQEIEPKTAKKARQLLGRWQRDLPLQSGSGATFIWRRRDPKMLAEGELVPDRNTTGVLNRQHGTIVFRGRIELGRIGLDTAPRVAPKASTKLFTGSDTLRQSGDPVSPAPTDVPALTRSPGPPHDPNKGRFGGKSANGGFSIRARFEPSRSKYWVTLTLIVEAVDRNLFKQGDAVLFCLHPTFYPQWIKATFRHRRASISLKTWGGFTVGVWLPVQQVELECDLSELPDAPPVIRDL